MSTTPCTQQGPIIPLMLILLVTLLYIMLDLTVKYTDYRPLYSIFPACNQSGELKQVIAEMEAAQDRAFEDGDLRFIPEQNTSTIQYKKMVDWNYAKNRMRTDVLDHWAWIAEKANITWYMICGTLLGSYRHHMMIPWDHDYDVCVARSDRNKTVAAYQKYMNKTKFYYRTNERWLKHYSNRQYADTGNVSKRLFKWPFLDIFWMDENKTDIWSPHEEIYHKRSNIFPLTTRPFHGRMFPSPRDPRAVLKELYGHGKDGLSAVLDKCGWWNNKVNCTSMLEMTPFVQHTRGPGGAFCKEQLVLNGTIMDTFTRTAQNIPIC